MKSMRNAIRLWTIWRFGLEIRPCYFENVLSGSRNEKNCNTNALRNIVLLDEQSIRDSFKHIDFTVRRFFFSGKNIIKHTLPIIMGMCLIWKVVHIQLINLIKVCSLNLICTTPGLDTPISIICSVCSGTRMDRNIKTISQSANFFFNWN